LKDLFEIYEINLGFIGQVYEIYPSRVYTGFKFDLVKN